MSEMTHRDRMLATMRGQPTDQIPWAPRMDLWYIAQRARGTLPKTFAGLTMVEVAERLDVACHAIGGDFTLPGSGDNRLRGLGIDNYQDYPYPVIYSSTCIVPNRWRATASRCRLSSLTPFIRSLTSRRSLKSSNIWS
jgi:hypothetical protein